MVPLPFEDKRFWKQGGTVLNTGVILLFIALTSRAGTILVTFDGGENWEREIGGTPYALNAVAVDPLSTLAVAAGDGGTVLRRPPDAGWERIRVPGLEADLNSVAVGSNGTCMICGDDGTLLSSFDGGSNWRVWEDFDSGGNDLYTVSFDPSAPGDFLIAGENGFLYDSRSGNAASGAGHAAGTCVELCHGFPSYVVFEDGSLLDAVSGSELSGLQDMSVLGMTSVISGGSSCIAVGTNGSAAAFDGGFWQLMDTGTGEDLNGVAWLVQGNVICVAGDSGTIRLSRDRGGSWQGIRSGVSSDLRDIAGNGAGFGVAVGDGILQRLCR